MSLYADKLSTVTRPPAFCAFAYFALGPLIVPA